MVALEREAVSYERGIEHVDTELGDDAECKEIAQVNRLFRSP